MMVIRWDFNQNLGRNRVRFEDHTPDWTTGVYPMFQKYLSKNVTDESDAEPEEGTTSVKTRGQRAPQEMGMNMWGEPLLLSYVLELAHNKENVKVRQDIIRKWIEQHYSKWSIHPKLHR